jgi:hypothetical protein
VLTAVYLIGLWLVDSEPLVNSTDNCRTLASNFVLTAVYLISVWLVDSEPLVNSTDNCRT